MLLTENLDVFLLDFGVEVSAGQVSGKGLFDKEDEILQDLTQGTVYSVTVKTSEFGDLVFGDAIEVDGDEYTVKEVRKIGDGQFSKILLSDE